MKEVRVVGLAKAFGPSRAVDGVSFEVPAGSLVTLLGPSGCGKTTTLRLIAGLEQPDAGEVYVGDRLLTSASRRVFLNPEKRRMGMVFQTYAIWPHMSVFENVAFPLRAKRAPASEIRDKVMSVLETIGLGGFHDRPAPLLSGGQQQRVALGPRARGRSRGAPARRALLQPRRQAARGDALRAEGRSRPAWASPRCSSPTTRPRP